MEFIKQIVTFTDTLHPGLSEQTIHCATPIPNGFALIIPTHHYRPHFLPNDLIICAPKNKIKHNQKILYSHKKDTPLMIGLYKVFDKHPFIESLDNTVKHPLTPIKTSDPSPIVASIIEHRLAQ